MIEIGEREGEDRDEVERGRDGGREYVVRERDLGREGMVEKMEGEK